MTAGPGLTLVERSGTHEWHVELRDLKAFRERVGPDVMNGFACCFVHTDRLMSLISFAYISAVHYGEPSPCFHRNLQTMVWYTAGTLRELALSIRNLRSALAKRQMLDPTSKPWVALRAIEARWEDDPAFRGLRNIVSFHVDPLVVEKGLLQLETGEDVILSQGRGGQLDQSTMRLGLEALLNGTGRSLADLEDVVKVVSQDQGISTAVQEAFILALNAAGIPVERIVRDA